MKKKLWTGILAVAFVFSIGSISALAAAPQYPGCRGSYEADGAGASFVDENGDGICDNAASGVCGGGYGCGAGRQGGLNQGSCLRISRPQWHVAADGSRVRCVDAGGNGVCDTCRVPSLGAGFVDEDNDGICDNNSSGICRGGYCGGGSRQGGGHGGRRR